MHCHGKHRFVFWKSLRHDLANLSPWCSEKCITFPCVRICRNDTNIPVEQTQVVVVLRDHHWTMEIPSRGIVDQPFSTQHSLDLVIECADTKWSVTQRGKNAKAIKLFQ